MTLILVLAGAITYVVFSSVLPGIGNHAVSNQSIGFALNETAYPLNRTIYTASPYVPYLTYANGTTNVSNYSYTSTTVLIGANIPNGTSYYGHYTYYDRAWIAGTDYGWLITVIFFIAATAIMMYFLRVF